MYDSKQGLNKTKQGVLNIRLQYISFEVFSEFFWNMII